jgi:formyltetrahydrofolate deformylase
MNTTTANTARLLITCEDKPGIVQAVSSFLYHQGANITALDQYATEAQGGRYFMRVEFELDHLQARKEALMQTFAANVAERYEMQWRLFFVNEKSRDFGF